MNSYNDILLIACILEILNSFNVSVRFICNVNTFQLIPRHCLKLQEEKVWLDIRKNLLIKRVGIHWTRLPREVVETPSLDIFKCGLERKFVWDG